MSITLYIQHLVHSSAQIHLRSVIPYPSWVDCLTVVSSGIELKEKRTYSCEGQFSICLKFWLKIILALSKICHSDQLKKTQYSQSTVCFVYWVTPKNTFSKFQYWIDLTHVCFCVGAMWYTQMQWMKNS